MLPKVTIYPLLLRRSFFSLLVLLIVFCNTACQQEQKESKAWYKYADAYIKADEIMIQNLIEGKETFSKDYEARHQAESQLFNSPSPTMAELEQLLNSQRAIDRKVALVAIKVKHIYSEELFKTILKLNDPKDNYFIKSYSYQSFKFLDGDKVKQYEDELIKIISWETNEAFIIAAMPTLTQVGRTKSIPLFARFFKTGTDGLKRATYVYLKKIGNGYLDDVNALLKKENAVDALNFIEEAESGKGH